VTEKQAALTSGDFSAYGVADKKLNDAVAELLVLLDQQ